MEVREVKSLWYVQPWFEMLAAIHGLKCDCFVIAWNLTAHTWLEMWLFSHCLKFDCSFMAWNMTAHRQMCYFMDNNDSYMVSAKLIWQAFFGIRQPKSSSVMSVSIAWKYEEAIFTLTPWRCLKWRTQLLSYCFHCQLFLLGKLLWILGGPRRDLQACWCSPSHLQKWCQVLQILLSYLTCALF